MSKQPYFKYAAVHVRRVAPGDGHAPADPTQVEHPADPPAASRRERPGRRGKRARSTAGAVR